MFALTSHGAQVDYTVMHGKGPYTFRIHDQNCHAIGTLIPYDKYKPKYAQLYIYGTYNEIESRYESLARKKEQAEIEKQTDKAIIACLKESFDESHKYVKVFRRARIWHEANKERKYTLKLIEPRKRGATRSYDQRVEKLLLLWSVMNQKKLKSVISLSTTRRKDCN